MKTWRCPLCHVEHHVVDQFRVPSGEVVHGFRCERDICRVPYYTGRPRHGEGIRMMVRAQDVPMDR